MSVNFPVVCFRVVQTVGRTKLYLWGLSEVVGASVILTPVSVPAGTPSPAGHLSAAGLRREAGQHGHPRPRGGEQHHLL